MVIVRIIGAGLGGVTAAEHLRLALPEAEIHVYDNSKNGIGGESSLGHPGMCSYLSVDWLTLDRQKLAIAKNYPVATVSGTKPGKEWSDSMPITGKEYSNQLRIRRVFAKMGMDWQVEQFAKGHQALKEADFKFGDKLAQRFFYEQEAAQHDADTFTQMGVPTVVEEGNFPGGAYYAISFPGGLLHPHQYCVSKARILKDQGVYFHGYTTVDRIVVGNKNGLGKKVIGVMAEGELHAADAVVVSTCANMDLIWHMNRKIADSIAPFSGAAISIDITESQTHRIPTVFQAAYKFKGEHLLINSGVLHTNGKYELRIGGGFIGGVLEKGARFDFALDGFKEWIKLLVPEHEGEIREWHGVRAMPARPLPIVGPDANYKGLWYNLALGSSGTSLARPCAMFLSAMMERSLDGQNITGNLGFDPSFAQIRADKIGLQR